MIRRLGFLTAALVVAVLLFVLTTLPPAPRQVTGGDSAPDGRTIPGAFHIHTTRSDGAADKAAVARAAARAGLRFAVFTDHGDGTRPPDPPAYIDGVLCLDGVEISTNGGHYAALGMRPAPYPLGGEPRAVVEDVARLGGFGVVAHPGSLRAELAWRDWPLPFDAVEWLNADSEWRDERRVTLARTILQYLMRPAAALSALLDRPSATLARWDAEAARRRVLAFAAHDAHGGIGGRPAEGQSGRTLHVPSYESSFRVFSVRAILDRPFTGDAPADAVSLMEALRAGHAFTAIDALAQGGTLNFQARASREMPMQGDLLTADGPATYTAKAAVPEGASIVLLMNGEPVAERPGGTIEFESSREGAFRVEVRLPGAPGSPPVPWLLSNPIFRHPARPPDVEMPVDVDDPAPTLALSGSRIEKDPGSIGEVIASPGGAGMRYELRGGARASQFVALVADLPADLPQYEGLAFTASAASSSRVSVQLRFAKDGDQRWGRSIYVDREPQAMIVREQDLVPAERTGSRPDLRRATSLLFVVDLTNANPGTGGEVYVSDLRLLR